MMLPNSSGSEAQVCCAGFVTCELQLAELRCSFMGLTQAESLLDVRIPQKVKRP